MKGFVVGKEINRYTPAGATQEKVSRTLHVVWDARPSDGLTGKRVEPVYCPFDVDDIPVGSYCDFEYEIRNTSKGNMARLVDVIPLGEAEILLVPPTVK